MLWLGVCVFGCCCHDCAEFRSRWRPRLFLCGCPGMVFMSRKCIESSVDASESVFFVCYCHAEAEFRSRWRPCLFCGCPGMVLMANLARKCAESSDDASGSVFLVCYCHAEAASGSRWWPRPWCGSFGSDLGGDVWCGQEFGFRVWFFRVLFTLLGCVRVPLVAMPLVWLVRQ